MNKLRLIFSLFLASQISFAQTTAAPTGGSTIVQAPMVPTTASGGNINGQAQQAQKANNQGTMLAMVAMGVSAGVVATFIGNCYTDHDPASCAYTAAGIAGIAISMMIGSSTQNAANSAVGTQGQVTALPAADGPANTTPTNVPALTPQQVGAALAAQGVGYDASTNTATMPDGSQVSMGQLASGDFSQMGLSASGVKQAQAKMADMFKEAQDKVAINAGDLSGSGGSSLGGDQGKKVSTADLLAGLKAKAAVQLRKPTSVAGLKRLVNGEAIGVASDSLFDMVKRRYDLKGQQNTFVDPAPEAPKKN